MSLRDLEDIGILFLFFYSLFFYFYFYFLPWVRWPSHGQSIVVHRKSQNHPPPLCLRAIAEKEKVLGVGTTLLRFYCIPCSWFLNYDSILDLLSYVFNKFFKMIMPVLVYFVNFWTFSNILQLLCTKSFAGYSASSSKFTLQESVLTSQTRLNWAFSQSHLFLQKLRFLTWKWYIFHFLEPI